jgi:hypothetical protein
MLAPICNPRLTKKWHGLQPSKWHGLQIRASGQLPEIKDQLIDECDKIFAMLSKLIKAGSS